MGGVARMTMPTRAVLAALMEQDAGERYGLALARTAGLSSGTLYPILARLEAAGFVVSRWEDVDETQAGRPRRRYYQLTEAGVELAHTAVPAGRATAAAILSPRPA